MCSHFGFDTSKKQNSQVVRVTSYFFFCFIVDSLTTYVRYFPQNKDHLLQKCSQTHTNEQTRQCTLSITHINVYTNMCQQRISEWRRTIVSYNFYTKKDNEQYQCTIDCSRKKKEVKQIANFYSRFKELCIYMKLCCFLSLTATQFRNIVSSTSGFCIHARNNGTKIAYSSRSIIQSLK